MPTPPTPRVLAELAGLVAEAELEVPVAEVYPLDQVQGGIPRAGAAAYQGKDCAPPVTAGLVRSWDLFLVGNLPVTWKMTRRATSTAWSANRS